MYCVVRSIGTSTSYKTYVYDLGGRSHFSILQCRKVITMENQRKRIDKIVHIASASQIGIECVVIDDIVF